MGSRLQDRILALGYGTIGVMFLVFFTWSALVPLADSIIAPGTVSVAAQRRTIAHVEGGTVSLLKVSEGDYVESGQLLLELDNRDIVAQLELLEYQRVASRLKLARLAAERAQGSTISFNIDLEKAAETTPHLLDLMESESGAFEARRKALESQSALFDERIQKGNEQLERLRQQLLSLDRQRSIVEQLSKDAKALYHRGFGTRNRAAELSLESESLLSQRLQIETERGHLLGEVEDARLNKDTLMAERAQEVEQELSETQRRLAELDVQIVAIEKRLDSLRITSPVRGVVIDLKVTSINDVVKSADAILDILPTESAYLVEAQIPPDQIEGIVEGMEVEVRFQALSGERVPAVMGKIAMVSADIINDPSQNHRFYKVHVSLADLQGRSREIEIIPGMPTEVIVKKHDRTLLQYIVAPFMDHFARSVV